MLDTIKNLHTHTDKLTQTYSIIFVANVREKTKGFTDYTGTSVISEFLTLNQYELIIETLRHSGYEVSSYFDENEFLHDCISQNYFSNADKQVIVINAAQKGTATGRKSLIPAFCDLNGLWHTNSNAYIVSLSRNKFHCNSILRANSFPVTEDYLFLPHNNWFLDKKPSIGELVIAKLNGEASSIGLTKDNIFYFEESKELFIQSLSKAYKQPVIVQPFISGYEVEVPVIIDGDICEVVLPVGISVNNKKQLNDVILDYNTRKNLEFGFYNFEELNSTVSASIEKCTKEIVKLLGVEGFGRVDFRIDLNGNYFITDVATNPHLTKGMSFNFAFEENGMDYKKMLETLIAITISKYRKRSALYTT